MAAACLMIGAVQGGSSSRSGVCGCCVCCVWFVLRVGLARVESQRRSVVWCVCKTCLDGPRSLIVAPNPGGINGHQRGGQGDWEGGSNASGRWRGRKRLRQVAMTGFAWAV